MPTLQLSLACVLRPFARGLIAVAALWAFPATAQTAKPTPAVDKCLAFSQNHDPSPLIQHASFRLAQLKAHQVKLRYIGHSTFLITSPKGVTIATDYNDYVKSSVVPVIATMNLAHDTHHSYAPDPKIRHVIRGWNEKGNGAAAIVDLTVQDVRVRNIPTNIRNWSGETTSHGNSIFVFEFGGLCVAHLGHLHHTLTVQHLAQIGQMDVVLVPVDGSYTLDLPGMMDVLKALKSPLIVPMHYFSEFTLGRFIEMARKSFDIERSASPELVVSRDKLPAKQKVVVLPPAGN